ncbi:alpha/beta fold hydrolase [Paenibacillus sp. 1001270B_150601_E10]|uniref:alpha/beta fold hydrolase n=1 Tax=Paenibacillus sp. 1001270B_150601_E10 TaxID=2787079 RepID=UPI00189D4CD3|nr:alpha/beta hydrolase [Paenibacillus sp. 1001270B_150601_E10]
MDLYSEVSGKGEPIVLIHSGGADLRDWTFVAPILAKHYQVIAFDGRGCGQSPSPTEPSDYVKDLLMVFEHYQLEQATIIGHSIGGQIATEFALKYPERVANLILIAPSLTGFTHSEEFSARMQETQAAAPDINKMMELSLEKACGYRVVMASPHREFMIDMWKQNISKIAEWATTEAVWPEPPAIERLHTLAVNTCFLVGEYDASDLHRIADCFRVVPSVRIMKMEGADHMPTLTHPEELCRHIIAFMED